jgi:hypothetical protein
VKITRPIVGILIAFVILQFAMVAGLWITSFVIDDALSSSGATIILTVQVSSLILAIAISSGSQWLSQQRMKEHDHELEASYRRSGGKLKAMLSPSHWEIRWRIEAPFALSWMNWIGVIAGLGFVLLATLVVCLRLWGTFQPTYSSNLQLLTALPLIYGLQALPILYSKWRELSQPTATPSPEVRPS